MAVTAANEHHVTEFATDENLSRFAKRTVIAVIETYAHERPGPRGGGANGIQLGGSARARFFHKHMLTGRGGCACNRREHFVRSCDYDNVHVWMGCRCLPIRESHCAAGLRQGFSTFRDKVATCYETAARKRLGALPADQATADDRCAHKSAA
jgi:hypothetical protein